MKLNICIIVLLLISFCNLSAQQQYLFSHIATRDGLRDDVISAIEQDTSGYMWLAMHTVLQRYDGKRFINFFPDANDPFSIPSGGIRSLVVDKRNRLWILNGQSNLGYLDVSTFKYYKVKVDVPQGISNNINTALVKDVDGNVILIFIGKDFVTFSEKHRKFAKSFNPFQLPAGWEPEYFYQDYNRCYWVGTPNGLLKYNANNKLQSYKGNNSENDPYINHFKDVSTNLFAFKEKSGRMWVISWPKQGIKIQTYSPLTGLTKNWDTINKVLKNEYFELHGITQLHDGSIWLAGHNLFAKLNPETDAIELIQENTTGEYSVHYDRIHQLFEDKEKNVWVCSNKGLFRFNPAAQQFRVLQNKLPGKDSIYTHDVTDLLETKSGEVLVSTWGRGIFSYDTKFTPIRSTFMPGIGQQDGMVWSMIQRGNGDIWRGIQGGYVYIYVASQQKNVKLKPTFLNSSTVRQLAEDKNGNIWLGTHGGRLVKWHADSNVFTLEHQLNAVISRIYIDQKNRVWVTTDRNGVYCMNALSGAILHEYHEKGAPGKTLLINGAADIIQYNDSLFMIASDGLNLLNIKNQSFTYITYSDGLPTGNISNLVKDNKGYIWMSTSSGIVSYHPVKQKLSIYNALDGVHTNTFSVGSGTLLKNGNIAFGTNHDFIVFDPRRVTVEDFIPPPVIIADFNLMNKSLLIDSLKKLSKITLDHNAHSFSIDLTTLTYQNTYPIYYMMEGLDETWIKAGNENKAVFNYLAPGKYTFKAACKIADGSIGTITRMQFHIRAPFYLSWWFYAVIALLIAYLFYLADRVRQNKRKAEEGIRASIAANLHDEVNTTLQNINVLSEIAGMKATHHPEQSKEYIDEIKIKSRNMVIALNDVLWSIDPENDSMHKTIERIDEWNTSLLTTYPVELNVEIHPNVYHVNLSMQKRHEFIVIYKLITQNLIEILKAEQTNVQIIHSKRNLKLKILTTVTNMEQQNAIIQKHMKEIKTRANAIGAFFEIVGENLGTSIILKIKI